MEVEPFTRQGEVRELRGFEVGNSLHGDNHFIVFDAFITENMDESFVKVTIEKLDAETGEPVPGATQIRFAHIKGVNIDELDLITWATQFL